MLGSCALALQKWSNLMEVYRNFMVPLNYDNFTVAKYDSFTFIMTTQHD